MSVKPWNDVDEPSKLSSVVKLFLKNVSKSQSVIWTILPSWACLNQKFHQNKNSFFITTPPTPDIFTPESWRFIPLHSAPFLPHSSSAQKPFELFSPRRMILSIFFFARLLLLFAEAQVAFGSLLCWWFLGIVLNTSLVPRDQRILKQLNSDFRTETNLNSFCLI